jgi:hypothetical protein
MDLHWPRRSLSSSPWRGAQRLMAATDVGHRRARGPARCPDHWCRNWQQPAPPIGDSLHSELGRGGDGEWGGGSGRWWRWDPSSMNFRSRKRMGTNGMYWVMGVTRHMATETSEIFGSGGAVRPDRLGAPSAVLVWSDWVVWVLWRIGTNWAHAQYKYIIYIHTHTLFITLGNGSIGLSLGPANQLTQLIQSRTPPISHPWAPRFDPMLTNRTNPTCGRAKPTDPTLVSHFMIWVNHFAIVLMHFCYCAQSFFDFVSNFVILQSFCYDDSIILLKCSVILDFLLRHFTAMWVIFILCLIIW